MAFRKSRVRIPSAPPMISITYPPILNSIIIATVIATTMGEISHYQAVPIPCKYEKNRSAFRRAPRFNIKGKVTF